METERLVLTPLGMDDAQILHRLNADPATWEHFPVGRWTDRAQALSFISMSLSAMERTGMGQYRVDLRESGEFVGTVGVFVMAALGEDLPMRAIVAPIPEGVPAVPEGALLNIGWRMERTHWGHGYATEAARAAMDYAIGLWPQIPMTAGVLSTNPASAAVCGHLGLSLVWSGLSGEALRVRTLRPPVAGGSACVRWMFADRDVAPELIALRVRAL